MSSTECLGKLLLKSFNSFRRYSLNELYTQEIKVKSYMTLTLTHDLQNLISSSMSGTECMGTMWLKSFDRFRRYSQNKLYIQEIRVCSHVTLTFDPITFITLSVHLCLVLNAWVVATKVVG